MSQEINNSPEASKVTYANSSTQTSVSEGSTKTSLLFEDMQKQQEAKEKYEKQLVAHRENINKLLEQGEYLKAIYAFVNPPKNPNLITGTAPDAAFGTLGMIKNVGKLLLNIIKNPSKLMSMVKHLKTGAVKTFDELSNVLKSLVVQSKPSKTLPAYIRMQKGCGYSAKTATEALRFGNVKQAIPTKVLSNIQTSLKKRGITNISSSDLKIVQMETGANGENVKVLYSYFNVKTGESILMNEKGILESSVKYMYSNSGELVDAVITPYGGTGTKVSEFLFNPKATLPLE